MQQINLLKSIDITIKQPDPVWAHWHWWLQPEYAIVWVTAIGAILILIAITTALDVRDKDRSTIIKQENEVRAQMRRGFKLYLVQAHAEIEEMANIDVNAAKEKCWAENVASLAVIQNSLWNMSLTELAKANVVYQRVQTNKILSQIIEMEHVMRRDMSATQISAAKSGVVQKAVNDLKILEIELNNILATL